MEDLIEQAKRFERVRGAFENKRYQSCRDELKRLEGVDRAQSEFHRWFARLEYREGNWTAAREHATARLRLVPHDEEMLRYVARACGKLKLWQDCADAWKRLGEIRPEWAEAWYQLARAAQRAGKNQETTVATERLAELAENDVTALLLSGRYHLECDEVGRAAKFFGALAKKDIDRIRTELRNAEGRNDIRAKAVLVSALVKAESKDKFSATVSLLSEELIRRAIAAERRSHHASALLDYAAAVMLVPDDALANRGIARCLEKLYADARRLTDDKKLDGAIEVYTSILRGAPLEKKASIACAKALTQLRDWPAAREAWRALSQVNGDVQSWVQYARASERSGRFPEAEAAWSKVQQLDANMDEAATAIARLPAQMVKAGRAAFLEGRLIVAYEILSGVPRNDSARVEADRRLEQLAKHLRKDIRGAYKQRNYVQIAGQGRVGLALLPNDPDILKIVGRAATHVQHYALAAQAWRRLMALRPGDTQLQLALIESCLRVGSLDEAHLLLQDVLRQEPGNEKATSLQVRLRETRLMEVNEVGVGETTESSEKTAKENG